MKHFPKNCTLNLTEQSKAIKMRIYKVHHCSSLPTSSSSSHHHHHHHFLSHRLSSLSPPSFLSLRPSKLLGARTSRHLRAQSAIPRNRFGLSSSMVGVHTLVPIAAVSGENAAATGSNGYASSSQYEGNSSLLCMIFGVYGVFLSFWCLPFWITYWIGLVNLLCMRVLSIRRYDHG